MRRILIVPDVHGRDFWKEAVKNAEEYDKVVFLGDYTDPYEHEGIGKDVIVDSLTDIIKFKEAHNDKTVLLIGNHDCSYIDRKMPRCRFDGENSELIANLFNEFKEFFTVAYEEKIGKTRYIFSHSGIEMEWAKNIFGDTVNQKNVVELINAKFKEAMESKNKSLDFLNYVSRMRGGWDYFPSCVWGDVRDLLTYMDSEENEQLSKTVQIVGHTQIIRPIIGKKVVCLDVHRAFVMEDGVIKELNGDTVSPLQW